MSRSYQKLNKMDTKIDAFEWSLQAFERQGRLWLKWYSNSPFRDQEGQLFVYNGQGFPSAPANRDLAAWRWDSPDGEWDTGLIWGTGWHCARGAQSPYNSQYVSFCRVITDATMGPDVAKTVVSE
jgi:hypothetical protein